MVEIRVVSGKNAGRKANPSQFPFSIGRSSKTGLCLSDPGIWDHHASVLQAEDGAFFLKPGPGAVVNIDGQTPQEHRLRNGDVFACGAAQLQFWIAPAPARSLTPVELSLWGLVASVVTAEVALLLLLR